MLLSLGGMLMLGVFKYQKYLSWSLLLIKANFYYFITPTHWNIHNLFNGRNVQLAKTFKDKSYFDLSNKQPSLVAILMSHNVNPWKYYKTKNQVELNLNWWNGKPRTMRSLLCMHVTRTSPENRQYKWFSHHCSVIKPRFPEDFKPFSEIRKLNLQKFFFLFWLFTGRPML